jgi:hypothetical protein
MSEANTNPDDLFVHPDGEPKTAMLDDGTIVPVSSLLNTGEPTAVSKAAPAKDPGQNALVNGTACLLVHFKRPGIKRKLRDDQYVAGTAEKALTGALKVIVDSPEYKQVAAFEGHVKFYLASKALPAPLYRWSSYLIPLGTMKAVDEFLETARGEWQVLVDAFCVAYPQRKAETMARLGSVAEESDYKTEAEVRADFGFDFEYVTMATPSSLKQISAAMFEREEARLAERLKTVEEQVTAAFREQFAEMVSGMKAMLDGEQKDGKAQRFHGWKIAKLQQYVENFKSEANVCGDSELVKTMDEASKLLAGINPKELKNDAQWRAAMSGSFAAIGQKLATMTQVRGKRMIDLDEEEVA